MTTKLKPKYEVYSTDESGFGFARFGIPTGKTRETKTCSTFGGPGTRKQIQIDAYEIIHPDLVGPEDITADVPDWLSERPCGVGAYLGKEWA